MHGGYCVISNRSIAVSLREGERYEIKHSKFTIRVRILRVAPLVVRGCGSDLEVALLHTA